MSSSSAARLTPKIIVGLFLLLTSLYLLVRIFHDPVKQELRYAVSTLKEIPALTPPSTDFAIVIDKIGATSSIVADVDPYNSQIYQSALRTGIAHAKGSSLPGQGSNIFLFAHSSADLLTAARYNSVFYLMHHLEPGDIIKVWYLNQEYDYAVTEKLFVSPNDTKYLTIKPDSELLTLMTCWPPGTTLKRLILIAKPL